ncbi:hypothetical protein [Aquabacterium humicola]|uniref:hypothetical protein n=1 Tax=Aquabacterium humicola TaxID=3237377 RepID=UPI002542F059|nr:hypothetical protein [Rubrivivax pictus]
MSPSPAVSMVPVVAAPSTATTAWVRVDHGKSSSGVVVAVAAFVVFVVCMISLQ